MAKRITSRVSDELNEKLDMWTRKLGITKSQLGGICITAGFDAVIRAVSPVDSLDDSQLIRILRAVGLTDEEVRASIEKESSKKDVQTG